MDFVINDSEEQKAYHIHRIKDIAEESLEMLPPISGIEDVSLVPLEDAVEPLIPFLPDIAYYVPLVKQRCQRQPVDRLSNDESASIMIYTMGWKPVDQCLHVALNRTLRSKERNQLEPLFLYLKLFLTALSRLPSVHQKIYREIEFDLCERYKTDEMIVWYGFNSCSISTDDLKAEKQNVRTLLTIECISGKNIRQHSYFESEDEILLFPMTQFKVQSVSTHNNEVYSIELQEIQPLSPLIYPIIHSHTSKPTYVANYDFNGIVSKNELPFHKYDKLKIIDKHCFKDWWSAKNLRTKQLGYVPANHISSIIDLTTCEWYFNETNRHDAQRFLRQAHNGKETFLIRPSDTNQSEESLSILDFNEDKQHFHVKHYRIRRTDQGLYYISRKSTFPSLQNLVNHYQINTDGLCCSLTYPCQKIEPIVHDGLSELDRCQLSSIELLSQDYYNEVYKGTYGQRNVAIKSMKINDKNRFLHEAKIMKELEHENIICLYGVYTLEEPILIVMEFIEYGSLLNYLRSGPGQNIELRIILDFIVQIINGMIYLGEKGYVHSDLTARNIYVGKCDIVKIGGFGLAKQLEDDRSTIDEESQLSIGWTAPEIVITNEYTIKSDVWSFGFLLYEIIFYISIPYLQYSVKEILQKVLDGYQLEKPNDCHEQYYEIMCSCWQNNSDNRPTFQTLFTRFDEFIKQLDLNDENSIYTEV
ncbi:unnamed protein product [Adineta steineri]|uniref:Multifunctional fusion protein n=1 Tax=Adineta steineri TaxID=433720 RepID=A0A814S277_9BILA|nr:unnamed protein product [Adineta steineri]CAF3791460.1 unnamed protein product [Adineta steineri]